MHVHTRVVEALRRCRCTVHMHCVCLRTASLRIACTLFAHCLRTACALPAYCLRIAGALPAHCLRRRVSRGISHTRWPWDSRSSSSSGGRGRCARQMPDAAAPLCGACTVYAQHSACAAHVLHVQGCVACVAAHGYLPDSHLATRWWRTRTRLACVHVLSVHARAPVTTCT